LSSLNLAEDGGGVVAKFALGNGLHGKSVAVVASCSKYKFLGDIRADRRLRGD